MTSDTTWNSPLGAFDLQRGDGATDLRAWDGTDDYLLEALAERGTPGRVLVVDDRFGALGVALAVSGREVVSWGDLEPARGALAANLRRAGLPETAVPWTSFEDPAPAADAVLVRLPRTLRRLAWIVGRLASLAPGTPVIFGARSKDVQKSAVEVAARMGSASSTRARHRARLIVAERGEGPVPEPPARTWEAAPGLVIRAYPGVFGEAKWDPGARLLASCLKRIEAETIVDLGCGAGVLGLLAAQSGATVRFRDASHLAVASARRTWEAAQPPGAAVFEAADVLAGVPDRSVDLILCNPPFHAGRALTTATGHRMISQSGRVLRPTGRLILVGNRHLGYHQRLPRHFARVDTAASDRRFVVFDARKPR